MKEIKATKRKHRTSKGIENIIRTSMRNNIELTNIADNKANVLLSVNALIITFLLPVVLSNLEKIKLLNLGFPLGILVITSLLTISLSVLVLIPRGFGGEKKSIRNSEQKSPFFFGNFYQMKKSEFQDYFRDAVTDSESIHNHIIEDLYYVGCVLGQKMTLIRLAFRIFLVGFLATVLVSGVLLFIAS